MKFIPRESITSLKLFIYGIKGSTTLIPLLIKQDACQGHGLNCPLKAGVQAELVFSLKIPTFYMLRGEYGLEASIKDQNGNLVVCGKIDLELA